MKEKYVGIICSSSDDIDNNYKSIARGISSALVSYDYNLAFGGASKSMMGICYDEFSKHDKKIYAFTTKKYKDDLELLPKAKGIVCETTFDLKKEIFENSDVIVVLPGGIGTYSELLSFIEEKRSNNIDTPIEIYDEDGYFLPLIETLKIMELKNFEDGSSYELFNVSHNFEEFREHMDSYQYKRGANIK